MKFRFIREHLPQFPLEAACEILQVSRSGYYAWRHRPASRRADRRVQLALQIRLAHQESRRVYGSPRIYRALRGQGVSVCQNTVAKVMRMAGIRAKTKKKFVPRTTQSVHEQPVAENLLDRQFAADAPNQKWATDITYIATEEGWLYLAGVQDLFSRKIVGWAMAEHMRADLVGEALEMAITHRRPGQGLLHHSDRGSQYASDDYRKILKDHAMTASMSGRGQCWDNACVESFWGTLKTELVHHERYATRAAARQSIFEYIEVFYNRKRMHSSLGYLSPEQFEASHN